MKPKPYNSSNQSKYETTNPIKHWLLNRFLNKINQLLLETKPKTILEIGCGEGLILQRIYQILPSAKTTGIDINASAIQQAKRNLPKTKLQTMDATKLTFKNNSFDLTLNLEILEHLNYPQKAILEAKRVSKKYCIFSVPNEPWFSILSLTAGMNISRFGKHPEHVNFWTSKQFKKLINKHFEQTKTINSFPWTIVIAKKNIEKHSRTKQSLLPNNKRAT